MSKEGEKREGRGGTYQRPPQIHYSALGRQKNCSE